MILTEIPLPDRALVARARLPAPPCSTLVRPWRRPGDEARLIDHAARGLAALAIAVAGRIGRAPIVAMPGWISNQALEPLRRTGARLLFLPVLRDGSIDWDAAEGIGAVDLLMVVHAFGRPADLEPARAFRARRGCLLVEDATETLGPAPGIADAGDAVLYSPGTMLPVPEAAVVTLAPTATGWATALDHALGTPPPAADDRQWLTRRLMLRALPDLVRPLLPRRGPTDFDADPPPVPPPPAQAPSDLSCRLLAAIDLAAEARRRRDNAEALLGVIRRVGDLRPLFPNDGWVPGRLAVRATSPAAAARHFATLVQARLPVTPWPDLPPEVSGDPAHAEGARALRQTVLVLPVHGALDPDRLAAAYAAAWRESGAAAPKPTKPSGPNLRATAGHANRDRMAATTGKPAPAERKADGPDPG